MWQNLSPIVFLTRKKYKKIIITTTTAMAARYIQSRPDDKNLCQSANSLYFNVKLLFITLNIKI